MDEHLHNIISEHIIIAGVKMGFNRQDIHERLRLILTASANTSFKTVIDFTLDPVLKQILDENKISMIPQNYIGRCIEQIDTFYAGQFGI